jgi:hypothetical protein
MYVVVANQRRALVVKNMFRCRFFIIYLNISWIDGHNSYRINLKPMDPCIEPSIADAKIITLPIATIDDIDLELVLIHRLLCPALLQVLGKDEIRIGGK